MALLAAAADRYNGGVASSVASHAGGAPVVVTAEYYASYRTPRFRWWHPLVALGLFAALWGLAVFAAAIVAVVYEVAAGTSVDELSAGPLPRQS